MIFIFSRKIHLMPKSERLLEKSKTFFYLKDLIEKKLHKYKRKLMILVLVSLLAFSIIDSAKQSSSKAMDNLNLSQLQANYIGKLYAAPGTVVPSHFSQLEVTIKISI
jgi:hypothetical protein